MTNDDPVQRILHILNIQTPQELENLDHVSKCSAPSCKAEFQSLLDEAEERLIREEKNRDTEERTARNAELKRDRKAEKNKRRLANLAARGMKSSKKGS